MNTAESGEQRPKNKLLAWVVNGTALVWLGVFLLGPFAFTPHPSRALQILFYLSCTVGLALFGWGVVLVHRVTGIWAPRVRPLVLGPQDAAESPALQFERPLATVADLLTSVAPFSPRVDMIVRPAGLVFVRRRAGRAPHEGVPPALARRLEDEERASLRELLDWDDWNRFVPWHAIRQVRIPGVFQPPRVRFDMVDGSRLTLWAWDARTVNVERGLSKVLRPMAR